MIMLELDAIVACTYDITAEKIKRVSLYWSQLDGGYVDMSEDKAKMYVWYAIDPCHVESWKEKIQKKKKSQDWLDPKKMETSATAFRLRLRWASGSAKEPIRVSDLPMWRMVEVEPRGGTATGCALPSAAGPQAERLKYGSWLAEPLRRFCSSEGLIHVCFFLLRTNAFHFP